MTVVQTELKIIMHHSHEWLKMIVNVGVLGQVGCRVWVPAYKNHRDDWTDNDSILLHFDIE